MCFRQHFICIVFILLHIIKRIRYACRIKSGSEYRTIIARIAPVKDNFVLDQLDAFGCFPGLFVRFSGAVWKHHHIDRCQYCCFNNSYNSILLLFPDR